MSSYKFCEAPSPTLFAAYLCVAISGPRAPPIISYHIV